MASARPGLVLANTDNGLGVLAVDTAVLRRSVADGSFGKKTCPAKLGFAVTGNGKIKHRVAREGWLDFLISAARHVLVGEFLVIEDELLAGESAVEAAAASLGMSADEVVGVLLADAEAWAEWAGVGAVALAANPSRRCNKTRFVIDEQVSFHHNGFRRESARQA